MFKKVYIHNSSETSCSEKRCNIRCSVCKTIVKSILYVCVSGHVICKSCQNGDSALEDSNEGGDYSLKNECSPNDDKKDIISISLEVNTQDQASGDHDEPLTISQRTIKYSKKDSQVDDISETKKNIYLKSNPETTIEYKNENYQESISSVTSNTDCLSNTKSKEAMLNCKIVQRPVVCPVTNCSKMVTIDSIMLHFHFDHSKVPRIVLDGTSPVEVSLKFTNLSTEIQCMAACLIQTQKSKMVKKKRESITSLRNSFKDNKLLLLMAVRLPTSPMNLPNLKCDTSRVFTRSIHTQTEKLHKKYLTISTESLSKTSSDYRSCISKPVYDEDEVILLWLCKFDDEAKVYSITLLGEDMMRGYCYIGDASHIKDKQDPSSLYDKSECLIVKGSAVSNLCDHENQITVIVSILG